MVEPLAEPLAVLTMNVVARESFANLSVETQIDLLRNNMAISCMRVRDASNDL
jgi:hypothetical protein